MPSSMHGPSFLEVRRKFITAWFNSLTLFRSSVNDNDLKIDTRPDMAEEKLMTFSKMCILSEAKYSAYQNAHQQ